MLSKWERETCPFNSIQNFINNIGKQSKIDRIPVISLELYNKLKQLEKEEDLK
jgi:hypothetical protein